MNEEELTKYLQDMQKQIDFFNKKENRDMFVEYIEDLRKEIKRLNRLFYLFIAKLEHISKWGVKKYYKENIKLVIEEMKRLKGDDNDVDSD